MGFLGIQQSEKYQDNFQGEQQVVASGPSDTKKEAKGLVGFFEFLRPHTPNLGACSVPLIVELKKLQNVSGPK